MDTQSTNITSLFEHRAAIQDVRAHKNVVAALSPTQSSDMERMFLNELRPAVANEFLIARISAQVQANTLQPKGIQQYTQYQPKNLDALNISPQQSGFFASLIEELNSLVEYQPQQSHGPEHAANQLQNIISQFRSQEQQGNLKVMEVDLSV